MIDPLFGSPQFRPNSIVELNFCAVTRQARARSESPSITAEEARGCLLKLHLSPPTEFFRERLTSPFAHAPPDSSFKSCKRTGHENRHRAGNYGPCFGTLASTRSCGSVFNTSEQTHSIQRFGTFKAQSRHPPTLVLARNQEEATPTNDTTLRLRSTRSSCLREIVKLPSS